MSDLYLTDVRSDNLKKLVLYYHPYSSYSQKVILYLQEKGLDYEHKVINFFDGEHLKPWFYKLNNKGQIPVLQDEQKIIPDSTKIIEHLDENYSNENHPKILPEKDSTEFRKMIDLIDLMSEVKVPVLTFGVVAFPDLDPGSSLTKHERISRTQLGPKVVSYITKTLENEIDTDRKEFLQKKLHFYRDELPKFRTYDLVKKTITESEIILDKVEQELASHPEGTSHWWLCNKNFNLADINLAFLITRFEQLGLSVPLLDSTKRPRLLQYKKRLQNRSAYQQFLNIINAPPNEFPISQ